MKKNFFRCDVCGKKLIEKLPNGLWKFVFGRNMDGVGSAPVEMLIKGSVKMCCLKRSCDNVIILPYYPNSKDFQEEVSQSDLSE